MSLLSLIARTFVRYPVQIVLLTAIAFAPAIIVAHGVMTPANAGQARLVLRAAWLFAGSGVLATLVLVGALAPAVRAIARGAPRPQLAMFGAGLAGLVRALVPVAIAMLAVATGLLALAVPGVILFALFVLVPASEADGVAAALADSVAVVRAKLWVVLPVLAVILGAFAAIVLVQQLQLPTPLGKKPTAVQLAAFPAMVRATAIACACVAPFAALTLAAIHARARPS